MQKNYRDYTVSELLDMGLDIDVYNHNNPSKEEAYQLLARFEGVKESWHILDNETDTVKGQGDKFNNHSKQYV